MIITGHLRTLSIVANQLGQHDRAARLAGAEAAWRGKLGFQIPGPFDPFDDPAQTAAQQLGDDDFRRSWAEGQAMSLEEALAYAGQNA